MPAFDARPYLKEIARGRSARPIGREGAREIFASIFAGDIDDVALGAVLAAMRIKGESPEEIAGMMDALGPHVAALRMPAGDARPVLVPSYNGARKLANVVPLLALLLAREGVPVLLHGLFEEPGRVSAFEVLERMGRGAASSLPEAERALMEARLAVVPLALLSPALARVLELRSRMGVRNSGHTLAKLLLPAGVAPDAACRLVSVTHPDYARLMRDIFALMPGDALVMRGVEGEAVVRLHAPQPIEEMRGADAPVEHRIEASDADYELPPRDAQATADWTRDVLEGRRAAPRALAAQVALIASHCRRRSA
jgi:anthranilate phosphoribosyltransferase